MNAPNPGRLQLGKMTRPLRIAVLNRGESAVRFMRTARVWSKHRATPIELVALVTDAESDAMFARMADHVIALGDPFYTDEEGARKSSYVHIDRLMTLLTEANVDVVWPGWGFVAENPAFARACAANDIIFVGPDGDVMHLLGDKIQSKLFAERHNVPVSPWSGGALQNLEDAQHHAERIGFPLVLKAAAGGGGRGIRFVYEPEGLEPAWRSASHEAASAFGDPSVFLEALVPVARHVEVQIIADQHGNVWALGTRDCSTQRRHQKIIEEAPAPGLTPEVEASLCEAARRVAGACHYVGAGTAEFLLLPDEETFYFLEMNTRLQVEHTITEELYGVDLVSLQLDAALGLAFPAEGPPNRRGHAVELRVNAEEPDLDFAPATGLIHVFEPPGGPHVRLDTGYREGDVIPTAFDSNIAKLIAWGHDREDALFRAERALRETQIAIEGGLTNRAMLIELLTETPVADAPVTTNWFDGWFPTRRGSARRPRLAQALLAAALADAMEARETTREELFDTIWNGIPQRMPTASALECRYLVDGAQVQLSVAQLAPDRFAIECGEWQTECVVLQNTPGLLRFRHGTQRHTALLARTGSQVLIHLDDIAHRFERIPDGSLTADVAAVVTEIHVTPGQEVARGDRLVTLEVMKMEIHVSASMGGIVRLIHAEPGVQLSPGDPIMDIDPAGGEDEADATPDIQLHKLTRACPPEHETLLRSAVLGYDVGALGDALAALESGDLKLSSNAMCAMLEVFALRRLLFAYGPHDDGENEARESSAGQFAWFMAHRTLDEEALSTVVSERLVRLMALYGVDAEDDSPALRDALLRVLQGRDSHKRWPGIMLSVMEQLRTDLPDGEEARQRLAWLAHELALLASEERDDRLAIAARQLEHELAGDLSEVSEIDGEDLLDKIMEELPHHVVYTETFDVTYDRRHADRGVLCAVVRSAENATDRRLHTITMLEHVPGMEHRGDMTQMFLFERLNTALAVLREALVEHQSAGPFSWNLVTIMLSEEAAEHADPREFERALTAWDARLDGLSLDRIVVRAPNTDHSAGWRVAVIPSDAWNGEKIVAPMKLNRGIVRPLSASDMQIRRVQRRKQIPPEQLIELLTSFEDGDVSGPGTFTELQLDHDGTLRPAGDVEHDRDANAVAGLITHPCPRFEQGLRRVLIVGDVTRSMGSLAENECRLIIAALDLAEREQLPVEWITFSSGARIALDTGTENLDWTARVLRRIIEFTHDGGVIHVLVDGPSVGAQSYWNAEATMLAHCKGALFMTARGYMVLTGKRALEHSGCVSAEDNYHIGGLPIMAPNGEAQYVAPTLADAYHMLLHHYMLTYVEPQHSYTHRVPCADPIDRDATLVPYDGDTFNTIGEIFQDETNPGRKKPFAIRQVMRAVLDQDISPMERWGSLDGGESAVVFHGQLGGQPICMIGIESQQLQRRGPRPVDGPPTWTSGTLYPQSSRKVARAILASSGVQPVIVLANLSGFDGSPESLLRRQLEYGAEIGRAVVQFEGPIIFCVISRYHGGAYVVFSKTLNENLEALALSGTYASVIGGGPAAAVVFPRQVRKNVESDPRIKEAREAKARGEEIDVELVWRAVHTQKQNEMAKHFDNIHTVQRALKVGSLDAIIEPNTLRRVLCERTHRATELFVQGLRKG